MLGARKRFRHIDRPGLSLGATQIRAVLVVDDTLGANCLKFKESRVMVVSGPRVCPRRTIPPLPWWTWRLSGPLPPFMVITFSLPKKWKSKNK